jgi:hypothetical protein
MKRKALKIIGLLIFLISINACQEKGLAGKINRAKERAETTLEQIEDYKDVDFSKQQEEAHQLVSKLSPNFSLLKDENLRLFSNLANVEKANRKMNLKFDDLEKDLKYSIDQLSALYTEFKTNELTKEQAETYFQTEDSVLNFLILQFRAKETDILHLQERYQNLLPKTRILVDSLSAIH